MYNYNPNEPTINTIFTSIFNNVCNIYEQYSSPWIFKETFPKGVLDFLDLTEYNYEYFLHYTFSIKDSCMVYLIIYSGSTLETIKTFIGDMPGLIILIPTSILNMSTEINSAFVYRIYDSIFRLMIDAHISIPTNWYLPNIFAMQTIFRYFTDADLKVFTNKDLDIEKLKEIGKFSITELYDNLEIIRFLK